MRKEGDSGQTLYSRTEDYLQEIIFNESVNESRSVFQVVKTDELNAVYPMCKGINKFLSENSISKS